MNFVNNLSPFILGIFIILFYRFFLSTNLLIANDWPLLFSESRDFFPFWSIAWDYMGGVGLGGPAFKTFWIDLYTNFVYFLSNQVNIPWWLYQRIFWVIPFVALSIFSSYKFSELLFKNKLLKTTSSLIYSFNTYILLIVAGGQFGIAFSYAIAPLVLFLFINLPKKPNLRNSILFGLTFGSMVIFDPRVAFLIFLVQISWFLVFVRNFKVFRLLLLSLTITFLLNLYWILPLILFRDSSSIFSGYTSLEGVKFLSFANFSNSLSLLHPNWPENIFGKTYFLKPEFLIIPILAFSSLLFKVRKEIIFFAILALVGAFLGKGASEPFPEIYLNLFQLPGFNLFRDSTKFFILVAISYSILIPYALGNLSKFRNFFIVCFIFYWLIILKPGWGGELTGIFKPRDIPSEHSVLNEFIKKQDFARTLWVPKRQKYGFFDPSHPAVDSEALKPKLEQQELQELGIRYVIVPSDPEGEIFLEDRKYSEELHLGTVRRIENIEWLRRVEGFGKIAVFEVENPKDHFWSPSTTLMTNHDFINPTEYRVQVKNAREGDLLVFSEGFDRNWIAESSKFKVQSSKFDDRLNSFVMPEGDYELKIYYTPQKWVNIGFVISLLTFLALIYVLFMISYRNDRNTFRIGKKS